MLTTGLHALVVVMLLVGAVGPWLLTRGVIRSPEVQWELAAIVGSSDDAITGQAPDGTIVSWNDGAERLFGYTAGEVKGRPLSALLPAGRSSEIEELLERVRTGERVHHHETECARKDGTTFVGFLTISPIRDARGCVTGTSAITRDVSDRMTAEAGLRASEERLRAVLESASDAFVAVDASGTILEWNSQAACSFGWAPEEAIGRSLADTIIPPRHREEVLPALQRLLETSEGRLFLPQVELVHRDGRELLVEITVWPTPAGGTRIFNACIRDVSARRRTEGFLRLQRAMAAAANEAAGIEEALARCLEEVGASMGWPVGHALLVARGSGALESAGVWHMDDPGRYEAFRSETEASSFTGSKGLPGRILENGQPIWIADVTRDPGFQRARVAQDVGLRAALGIPVLVGAEVVAVLEFFWPQPAEPDDEVIEVLMHVGTQLGRVAERSAAQETLRASEERYRLLFESNPLPMWVYDVDTLAFLAVNDAAVAHYGYTREEFLSMAIADIRPAEEARGLLAEALGEPRPMLKGLWRHRKKNGSVVDVEVSSHGVVFGGWRGRLVLANDVTERQMLEAQLTQQALHDPLTGLANRALYRDRVEHALAAGIRAQKQCAALFIDLDNFKTVNDSLGHAAGDELLKAVADRLGDCLRPEDTISRLGGDEFAILLDQAGEASAAAVAQRVVDALQAPFPIQEKEFFVTGSVGIATGRPDTHTAEELMRNADLAMYAAKARGKGGYQVFEPSMQAEALQRLGLEADLRHAAERGELFIHYQPVVMLQPIRIAGVEALVRWAHPERGVVAPADFIPIAEETGLILKIGVHVLQEACRQTMAWQLEHEIDPPLGVSVNVSPRQLRGEGLVGDVTRALADSGLPPGSLTLEITEGVLMQDTKSTMAKLWELKGLGVRLAIDDFGTGYSSLGYLRRFPIDVLKMDRSFTRDVTAETEDSSLARAIIRLGATLQLDVVAEGVEELEQVIALERLGCRYAQGYYFSKPIGPTEVSELLARASAPHGGRLRTAGTVSEGAASSRPPPATA